MLGLVKDIKRDKKVMVVRNLKISAKSGKINLLKMALLKEMSLG